MRTFLSALLFTMVVCVSTARVFTSADGSRKIDATITAYDEESQKVSIRRKDGKTFISALSLFSAADQTFIMQWGQGANQSYFFYGKEYPGHLELLMKILEGGGVGYGQTILYGPGHPPIVIGNGPTPFLAWVNGYDRLSNVYSRFNATGVNFDFNGRNWQARIAFQAGMTALAGAGGGGPVIVGGGNGLGISSVSGPLLYQQPQGVIISGTPPPYAPIIVVPRGPAPVFVNPFPRGGGLLMGGGGFAGGTRSFSRGQGISVRIAR